MRKRKLYGLMIVMLYLMLAGCGKDNVAEENEQDIVAEGDVTDAIEEDSQAARYNYEKSLKAGGHICPDFPEAESLAYVDEQFLMDSICPAIVRLEIDVLFGSGVIWKMDEEYIWIITNQHVLADNNEDDLLEVVFWDGIRTHGEIVKVSEIYDIGFVRVDISQMGYYTIDRYRQVRYDVEIFDGLNPGDDIFVVGSADYPAGNLYYGTIGNKSIYMDIFETEMLWAYCEVKAGMSGSGVFDRYGNLIGIVCGGNDEKEAAVLPIGKILEEWIEFN